MKKNNKWTNTIITLVILSIIIWIFPIMMDGLGISLATTPTDASVGVVATGNSGTMTLSQPLLDDSIAFIASVTSSSGTDTPVASTYAAATDLLTVTGLTFAGTRTLTTTYTFSATEGFPGLNPIMKFTPLILWVIIIFGTGVASIFAVRAKTKE